MSHIEDDDEFGSTGEGHAALMAIIWGPAINVAIFMALYSYRKWWGYVHGIAGLFACIYTLASSLPILFFTGIIQQNSSKSYGKYSTATLNYHYLVGIACMFVIVIETLLGITTKMMYFLQAKSINILRMRKVHAIFGYIIVILCKSDYLIIKNGDGGFWALLIQDIIFAILIIVWKIKFPKMEARVNELPKNINEVRSIESIRQLDANQDYSVFANYVYRIDQLKNYHPAGYQIVESVKNKEVDRYIYGMFSSEELPEIPIYSHSYKSFTLLGDPIAKISIPSVFSGFAEDEVAVKVSSLKIISEKERIYQMRLVRLGGSFSYLKYTDIVQLGRYYSITLNDEVTRLYTSVNFLVRQNTDFMKQHLRGYNANYGRKFDLANGKLPNSQESLTNNQLQDLKDGYVSILFKQYDNGKFTDAIIKKPILSLVLSCSKGQGLQMKNLKPGKIIIVAGGTGIYPFSDLIDLLYKSQLKKENPPLQKEIIGMSPILNDNPFNQFTFHLMAAFNTFDDIHPITFYQIAYLAEKKILGLTLKLKDSQNEKLSELKNMRMIQHSFEKQLESELKEKQISKVWICGPPKMNENVSKFLRNHYKSRQNYLIL